MKRITTLVLVLFLLATSSAMAFDGVRKGFVLGGGLGFAPSIKTSIGNYSAKESGTGLNLFLGYAWDEFNMLVYEGNIGAYSIGTITVIQGIDAVTWYHYYGPTGKSFFTAAGLGLYSYDEEGAPDVSGQMGILIGAGYEFSKHWQAGFYISSGKTKFLGAEIDHTTFSLLIGGVAF